jgi:exodeoxyribonuclease V beta subunit
MTEVRAFDAQALNLQHRHRIEASAGTGKTFSIATLYTRALIEQGAHPGQLLVVTFSRAATSELRERLRERVALAARRAGDRVAGRQSDSMDTTLLGMIDASLDAALASSERTAPSQMASLAQHLQGCAQSMDEAAIFTIHGFCQRLLNDYPADFALFDQPAFIDNQDALFDQAVADTKRQCAHQPGVAEQIKDAESSAKTLIALGCELAEPAHAVALLGDFAARLRQQRALLQRCLGNRSAFNAKRKFLTRGMPDLLLALADTESDAQLAELMAALPEAVDQTKLPGELSADLLKLCSDPASLYLKDKGPSAEDLQALTRLCAGLDQRAMLLGLAVAMTPAPQRQLTSAILTRLKAIKQRARVMSFDELISRVAQGLNGATLSAMQAAMQTRFRLAMVDEFQDTDSGQFAIFDRLFPRTGNTGMVFIGDPKQAIYGFRGGDVDTYLSASRSADQHWTLTTNYRSTPALIGAMNTLYAPLTAADSGLLGTGIHYEPVQAGLGDTTLRINGEAVPPLRLLASEDDPLEPAERMAQLIRHYLDGQLVNNKGQRQVSPGDIAVLCKSHAQIAALRQRLSALSIPSATRKGASVYLSVEAHEMVILLRALLAPREERYLRSLLASPLFGYAIAELDDMLTDHRQLEGWLERLLTWRQNAQRFGLVAVVIQLLRQQLPTLRQYPDSERRVRNWQHLAELTQSTFLARHSLQEVLRELQEQIHRAEQGDTAASEAELRLETDQAAVQLLTLHAAKGLQFPIVLLAPLPAGNNRTDALRLPGADDGVSRACLNPPTAIGASNNEAELQRLLYVGLTRAEVICNVLWKADHIKSSGFKDPVSKLLLAHSPDAPSMDDALARLRACAGIECLQSEQLETEPAPYALEQAETPRFRIPADPDFRPPWFLTSFTALVRGVQLDGQALAPGLSAEDEIAPANALLPAGSDVLSRYRGAQLGQVLHDLLEAKDFARWQRDKDNDLDELIEQTWRRHGLVVAPYDQPRLCQAIRERLADTCTTPFIDDHRLTDLERCSLAEMEFMLSMQGAALAAVSQRLAAAGIGEGRLDLTRDGQRPLLNGMLNGFIDLLACVDERWYVIDYKSNDLGPRPDDYAPSALHQAMLTHHYDLQAALYQLALHRHLARTLPDYQPHKHLGGTRYLFLRGLNGRVDSPGIYAEAADVGLILDLDRLMAGKQVSA